MYINGNYGLVQLVMDQVTMIVVGHRHVEAVMAQAKNDTKINKHL